MDQTFLRVAELSEALSQPQPKLRLKFQQGSSGQILEDVRDRRIDAGFSFFDNVYPEVITVKLCEIRVRMVAPSAWAAKVEGKLLDKLAVMPWIKPDTECPFMKVMEGIFEDSGIMITDYIEANSEDVIRGFVAAGKGISLLKQDDADAMVMDESAVICETG